MSRQFEAEAVILAGGTGSRLGASGEGRQKCLMPIDGKPILGHVLGSLSLAFESANVTLCVSYKADEVYEYVKNNRPSNIEVDFLEDEGHSKTAKLFLGTRGLTSGPFLATAGDLVVRPELYRETFDLVKGGDVFASAALSPELDEADTHALGRISMGRVTELILPSPACANEDQLRDMTVWGMTQDFYEYAESHPHIGAVPNLLNTAISEGKIVAGHLYEDKWVHVAYPEDLSKSMAA